MPLDVTHTSIYLAVVVISLALFVVSGRAPALARLMLSALLALGGAAAFTAAAVSPDALAASTAYAPLASYRAVMHPLLSAHPALTLGAAGTLLVLCAAGLLMAGGPARAATVTAMLALIAIVPLGAATAFPAPLFVAAALWLVSRSPGLLDDAALRSQRPARHVHGFS